MASETKREAWARCPEHGPWCRGADCCCADKHVPVRSGEARQPERDALAYATRLFLHLAPQCEPLPDLMGVLTQLDNAIVGVTRQQSALDALATAVNGCGEHMTIRPKWANSTCGVDVICKRCRALKEEAITALLDSRPASVPPEGDATETRHD